MKNQIFTILVILIAGSRPTLAICSSRCISCTGQSFCNICFRSNALANGRCSQEQQHDCMVHIHLENACFICEEGYALDRSSLTCVKPTTPIPANCVRAYLENGRVLCSMCGGGMYPNQLNTACDQTSQLRNCV